MEERSAAEGSPSRNPNPGVCSETSGDKLDKDEIETFVEKYDLFTSEEGLKMFPDYTFSNAPYLDIILVPSAYNMTDLVKKNKSIVEFIKIQNENTDYTVSNCAGASLIGETELQTE